MEPSGLGLGHDFSGNNNSGRAYLEVFSPSENRFVVYYTFNGENPGDRFGWSVASAGDVNDDGYDDVIIGAPWNDEGGSNAGKVYIYSGHDGSMLGQKVGERAGDQFGYAVGGGLKINNDSRDDIIVGAPLNDERGGSAGKAYLFAGGSWSKLASLAGEGAGDRFGQSVCKVGKTDTDSFDEFAIAAPYSDASGADSGKVYVYNGKTRTLKFVKKGARAGDRFGWSLSGTGRSNDDNWSDLAVGSPYFDSAGKANSGRVQLLSGRNGATLWTVNGDAAGDLFGYSLAGIGDVNGSGSGDVIIGAPNSDVAGDNAGRAYVYSGGSGFFLRVFDGQQPGERFGWSVAGIGDVTGDFLIEVTVGANLNSNSAGQNAGEVYMYTAN